MSDTSIVGLAGVSTNNILVFGLTAASHAFGSVAETKLVSTPKRRRFLSNKVMTLPNTLCEQITWSPLLSSAIAAVSTADMPELVATQLSMPSSAASRS